MVKENMYFVPVSSPKDKHLKMKNLVDFMKLDKGALGAINFNDMIPVKKGIYKDIIFGQISDVKCRPLLKKQYFWLNRNKDKIYNASIHLYKLYLSGNLNQKVLDRCCDFKLLEIKCEEYSKDLVNI